MTFGSLPENLPAIATRKVKWDRGYQQKYGITTAAAENLPEGTVARLEQLSKRIFRALHLTGYARMDFRLRADGELFVLEANANPEYLRGRGLRAVRAHRRHELRRSAAADHAARRRTIRRRGAAVEPRPRRREAVARDAVQRFIHASTVSYHWMLSAGFNTQ